MATNTVDSGQRVLLLCKKSGTEHEKPVGNICERRDEKGYTSKDNTVKKTPKGKTLVTASNQDKMMELMLASMSSFTEKLTAMEERISGLTNKSQEAGETSTTRKSRSREKLKQRDNSEETQGLAFSTLHTIVQLDEGISYSHVFPDTKALVHMVRITWTPRELHSSVIFACTVINT